MKVKLNGFMLERTLQSLEGLSKKEVPVSIAWKILEIIEKTEKEFIKFKKLNEQIFDKYGEKKEIDGREMKQIPIECREGFEKLKELNEKEIVLDIEKLEKSNIEEISITTEQLMFLKPFIK